MRLLCAQDEEVARLLCGRVEEFTAELPLTDRGMEFLAWKEHGCRWAESLMAGVVPGDLKRFFATVRAASSRGRAKAKLFVEDMIQIEEDVYAPRNHRLTQSMQLPMQDQRRAVYAFLRGDTPFCPPAGRVQMWISPCCNLTTRVPWPNVHVERQMQVIQATALSMSCWGLTRGILAEPTTRGGIDMASLASYVQWVHSHSFVMFTQGVLQLSRSLTQPFEEWARAVGLAYNGATLPYLQLSPVVERPLGHLGGSLQSYSEVRKGMPVPPPPPPMRTGVMGLWHNALFRNQQRHTYAHMPSVRQGAVMWDRLVRSGALPAATVEAVAPSFRSKYPSVVQVVLAVQSGDAHWRAEAPCDMGKWAQAWKSRSILLTASRDRALFRPTSNRIWKIFARLRVPAFDKDFIRRALWRKLTVAQLLCAMTRQDHYPFEPVVETHRHFFEGCKFTEFLGSSIEHTYGQVELEGRGWVAVKRLPFHHPMLGLTTNRASCIGRDWPQRGPCGVNDYLSGLCLRFFNLLQHWCAS